MIERIDLGSSGLSVSRLGLGCGGPSRVGAKTHGDRDESVRVIRRAIELGITLIDTAEGYGTEELVHKAISRLSVSDRDRLVVITKKSAAGWNQEGPQELTAPTDFEAGIDQSLRRLGVDCIPVFMVHGLTLFEYEHATAEILPVLERARRAGKVGHVGLSEHFNTDRSHETLQRVLTDDAWDGFRDVVMVGHSVLQQTARDSVLPMCSELGLGTIGMFAVRKALTDPARLGEVLGALVESGEVDAKDIDLADPVGSISPDGTAAGLIGAAYRFSMAELGMNAVLTGTGSIEHLESNVAAVCSASPEGDSEWAARMRRVFARARSQTGQ